MYNPIIEISLLPLYTVIGISVYTLITSTSVDFVCGLAFLLSGGYIYSQAIQHIHAQ